MGEDGFEHSLLEIHVVGEIRKGDLWLHHPEFRRMAGGIGVLRPEGGAKGVDLAKGKGHALPLQLAGDGQIGRLPEEILPEVNGALFRPDGHASKGDCIVRETAGRKR